MFDTAEGTELVYQVSIRVNYDALRHHRVDVVAAFLSSIGLLVFEQYPDTEVF
jgi:hypothetical protein